jgi:predicted MFS family arabinose efflux permease
MIPAAESRQLRLAGVAAFGAMAAMRVCDPMLLPLASEFGRTVGEASHVVSSFAIAYGLLQLVYGPLGDRVGKLHVVALASAGCAAAAALVAVAPTLDALVLARGLMGAAAAGIIPLTMAWVGDNVPYEHRQETLARLLGATLSGMIAGQWLGAWITDALGWRYAFWGLVAVFGAAAWPLYVKTGVRQRTTRDRPETRGTPAHPTASASPLSLLRERRVRWVLGVTALEGALVFGTLAFVPSYLALRFELSTSAAGAVLALYGVGGLIYSRFAGRWVRAMGERGLAIGGGAMLGASLLMLSWASAWFVALPACMFAGTGFYMLHSTLQMQATQMAPTRRGAAVSLFSCALFCGQSLGVIAIALAVDHGWTRWAFSSTAFALVVLGTIVRRGVAPRGATAAQAS